MLHSTYKSRKIVFKDVSAKVIFGLILTSASATTLAKASNSGRMMNAAESYIQGYQGE
ncbi:hypothetical protein [Myxosarcina sp. GI1]|uniref:hypothetical protein n=1 Tax=Myxosarcina sp. GI1 TaxID=1541065 RepID=UPI00155A338E|nr:hypothetical protein [Myxosarcina sp. GI1]